MTQNAHVFGGTGTFGNASGPLAVPTEPVAWADTAPPAEADNRSLVLFNRGDEVTVQAGEAGLRFLLVSGKPLEEPVAWYGPIVMNTAGRAPAGVRGAPAGDVPEDGGAGVEGQGGGGGARAGGSMHEVICSPVER